ncbi:MAG: flagellar biosynthesis protein FlhB [Candidatus Latescibacterota bacterium]|nr:flagellar biosynthesis protein FlhB [Candidatus Latescibacterota bacterium]
MAEESFQEKTEQATPKRREEAREKGQVARSTELSSVAILAVGVLSLYGFGEYMGLRIRGIMTESFTGGFSAEFDAVTIVPHMMGWIQDFAVIVWPIVALLVFSAIAVNVAQVGVLFTGDPLMPKGNRISPLQGIKRIISKRGLVELAKGLFKVAIVALVTYLTIRGELDTFVGFVDMGVGQIFELSVEMILSLALRIILLLLLLALLDYAFQRWDYEKNLRMTRQEVKEELKQQEGDPLIRSRIRSIQREMAQKRMMGDVGEADVVVTNPTHFAVALNYDPGTMPAPVVVAKGQRLVAHKIKELARAAGVPLVENKPLARALFKSVQVGDQIPEELFKATAEVLAFVFQLKSRRRGIGEPQLT